MGAAVLSWYPDPYAYDVKNTRRPFALGLRYVLGGLKAPILWSAVVCGTYSGVECVAEGMRDATHEATYLNSAVAGAAAGMVMGSMTKRLDVVATSALGMGALMGMIEYNGQTVVSDKQHASRKWDMALSQTTPDSTTVSDLKETYPEYKDL